MKRVLLAGLGGLLMAMGLGTSGMTNPSRIVGFLDFAGDWDPTALLVMLSAAAVFAIGHRFYLRRSPKTSQAPVKTPRTGIDLALVAGSLMFGVGWGLSGLCPGPALVAVVAGSTSVVVFVVSMTAGMAVHALVRRSS